MELKLYATGTGKALNLYGVALTFSGDFLSDLFFNYKHDNYDALFEEDNSAATGEDMEAAIRKDADIFVSRLPASQQEAYPDLAQALAADFMQRL